MQNQYGRDSYTKVLLDLTTDFSDRSLSPHTFTPTGSPSIDSSTYHFPSASGKFTTAGNYISSPYSTDWDLGSGDFSIDFWYKAYGITAAGAPYPIWNEAPSPDFTGWGIDFVPFPDTDQFMMNFIVMSAGAQIAAYTSSVGPTLDAWHHYAVGRRGANFYIWKDGYPYSVSAWGSLGSGAIPSSGSPLLIGTRDSPSDTLANIQEIRLSKGILRWVGNSAFVVPVRLYT